MIDRRAKNVQIFEDTINLIKTNSRASAATLNSISKQMLYLKSDSINLPEAKENRCSTIISRKRSLEAASSYAREGKKVCVLNFASATNPGGGVTHGSSAQEECICRCSTIYPCLNVDVLWDEFYQPHRDARSPLYNDDCIYTPDVLVVKSDISFPERMKEEDWYQVDILTCAAPNLRDVPSNAMNPCAGDKADNISDEEIYNLHLHRIDKIFSVAAINGADVLILGAFGCGAFCNPPEIVAKAFREVQKKYESYLEVVEYAIFCGGHETRNYDAFCRVFDVEKTYDISRFIEAHNDDYERALAEIKEGRKRTHWMWYIFPQILGLGMSRTSIFYAIADLGEATCYMNNPVLGAHMIEICNVLLSLDINDASKIFSYPDDLKLKSSMTLFEKAFPENDIFGKVLDKYFHGERDAKTLELIK